jgi:hypothetical protein
VSLFGECKKLFYEESFLILKDWLEKCNQLRHFDFSVNSELHNKLKNVYSFYPLSYNKLFEENQDICNLINGK